MGERVANTGVLTTINLAIIAIAAVLTVIAILYGARQKRRRNEADRIEAARIEDERVDTPEPTSTPAPRVEAAAPPAEPAPASVPPPVVPATEPIAPPVPVEPPLTPAAPRPASEPAAPKPPVVPVQSPVIPTQSYASSPLTILKGLGPKVAALLGELGITTVGQLAALDMRAAQDLDARLGPFTGRMTRDRWVEQARLLAAGDRAGFEAAFGKL